MVKTNVEEIQYNVCCIQCGSVLTPNFRSPLWWKAHKRAEEHRDALLISGEECGCIEMISEPDAPYRVSGFTFDCEDFNLPFNSFTKAVETFLRLSRKNGFTIHISGNFSQKTRDYLDNV